jgi:hypothetical protein
MVRTRGYCLAAQTNARAIPVLPLVGSITVTSRLPCFSFPCASAAQIIDAPIRHFTEYEGLRPSIFANTIPGNPAVIRLMRTSGVRPMLKLLSSNIFPMSILLLSLVRLATTGKRQGRSLDLDGPHTHPRGGCLARFFALSEDLLCQLIVFLE